MQKSLVAFVPVFPHSHSVLTSQTLASTGAFTQLVIQTKITRMLQKITELKKHVLNPSKPFPNKAMSSRLLDSSPGQRKVTILNHLSIILSSKGKFCNNECNRFGYIEYWLWKAR